MSGAIASAFLPRSALQSDLLYAFGGGDPRVTIAILDGPVDRTHECFRGARLTPIDDSAVTPACDDSAMAQGSHSASVIFGQACSSVEGQAPLCRGLIVPIFADGAGCTLPHLARAIMVAVEHGAQIIHVSGGTFETACGGDDKQLAKALALCQRRNVLIIAASGRRGCGELQRIAAAPSAPVLAVEAIEQLGWRELGDGAAAVGSGRGVALPGARILGAALEGRVTRRSGASSAAALASGLAGLLVSRQMGVHGSADPLAIRALLRGSASMGGARAGFVLLQTRRDIERIAERAGLAYPVALLVQTRIKGAGLNAERRRDQWR
jgi:subtilisin family serine protease